MAVIAPPIADDTKPVTVETTAPIELAMLCTAPDIAPVIEDATVLKAVVIDVTALLKALDNVVTALVMKPDIVSGMDVMALIRDVPKLVIAGTT
jgi:hypothetical protein